MTDVYRVELHDAEGNVAGSHIRATQTQALQDATAFRKLGHSSNVYKTTLKKLPLKELLAHLFNQENEEFVQDEVLVKEVKGVKNPKAVAGNETDGEE